MLTWCILLFTLFLTQIKCLTYYLLQLYVHHPFFWLTSDVWHHECKSEVCYLLFNTCITFTKLFLWHILFTATPHHLIFISFLSFMLESHITTAIGGHFIYFKEKIKIKIIIVTWCQVQTQTFSHISCSTTGRPPLHCNPLWLVLSSIAWAIGLGVGVLSVSLTEEIPSLSVASAISNGVGVLLASPNINNLFFIWLIVVNPL